MGPIVLSIPCRPPLAEHEDRAIHQTASGFRGRSRELLRPGWWKRRTRKGVLFPSRTLAQLFLDLEGEARDCGAGAKIGVQTHVAGCVHVMLRQCHIIALWNTIHSQ